MASNKSPSYIHHDLDADNTTDAKYVLGVRPFAMSNHDPKRTRLQHECVCSDERPWTRFTLVASISTLDYTITRLSSESDFYLTATPAGWIFSLVQKAE